MSSTCKGDEGDGGRGGEGKGGKGGHPFEHSWQELSKAADHRKYAPVGAAKAGSLEGVGLPQTAKHWVA